MRILGGTRATTSKNPEARGQRANLANLSQAQPNVPMSKKKPAPKSRYCEAFPRAFWTKKPISPTSPRRFVLRSVFPENQNRVLGVVGEGTAHSGLEGVAQPVVATSDDNDSVGFGAARCLVDTGFDVLGDDEVAF